MHNPRAAAKEPNRATTLTFSAPALCLLALLGCICTTGVASAQVSDPTLVIPAPSLPLQPVGVPFEDPAFHTTIRRITGDSESGGFATHIYNQLQAFSADNAYVLLIQNDAYVVRRMSDLSQVAGLDLSDINAPRWQPAISHTLVHYDTNGDSDVTVQYTDVDTGVTTDVYTFPPQYLRIRGNQSFDELSLDGRWMTGMLARDDGDQVLFSLDLTTMTPGALLPLHDLYTTACSPDPTWGEVEPDWVAPSPLGKYLVVQWVRDGVNRCSGLETFAIGAGAFAGRITDGHAHGDLGVMPDGQSEFFMTTELSSPVDPNRPAIGYRLLPGTATVSDPVHLQVIDWTDGEDHVSCQGPAGVCLVSWGGFDDSVWTPFESELFLLAVSGSVARLAHSRSSLCGYWVQARGSISRDGGKVIFASDWLGRSGSSCGGGHPLGRGDVYVVDSGIAFTRCGDGSVDPAEQCDDGNTASGDGCDSNCTVTGCGNHVVTGGEQCDDADTDDLDCCSSTCEAATAGQGCGDGSVCNGSETCDGAGTCTAGISLDCSDGDLCTHDTCDPVFGCASVDEPAPDCLGAGHSVVKIKTDPLGSHDNWQWKWTRGEATSLPDFGVPTAQTRYAICIWDNAAGTTRRVARLQIDPGQRWKSAGVRGYRYGDAAGLPDGVTRVRLQSGDAGSARITLNAKGSNLPTLAPATSTMLLALEPTVTVQLASSVGTCWSSAFSAARTDTATQFKAVAP